jgi:glucose-1-phosphate adenylyltransferase
MKGIGQTSVTLIHFEANIGLTEDLPKFNLFDNDNKILPPRLLRHQNSKKTIVEIVNF